MAMPNLKVPKPRKLVVPKADVRGMARRAVPAPIALFLLALTTGSVGTFAMWIGGTKAVVAVGLIAALVTGLASLWVWLRKRREARRAAAFREGLEGACAADGFVGDPGEAARLDDLRRNFVGGIDKFQEYGKDIYKLPWYVMVGEPGAGKTEAIRHSSIRFPDALQDRFQGVGGTYSMHWWFTNHAILLDTAGAMLMGEQSSSRFETFLRMLREHRPDCPINGLILAVPVDSLLLDDETIGHEKASQIAKQLGVIQDALQIRFPIYVVITKSDKIHGFREFCDADGNDAHARQMLGWSNPDDLDDPVDSERITRGMEAILTRLRSRRMALLQDPVPASPTDRRVDQVDSLYALPESMALVIARLKRYLEILFAGGEWVSRPPFFRGVYFTSSMREGSALDRELAAALAVSPDKLPAGGIWERERSFFLRDVFLEKMFHEKGLITSLRDTGQVLRRQLFTFYGATAACLAALLGAGWFAFRHVNQTMEDEAYLWRTANQPEGWSNGAFVPIVARIAGQDLWRYEGDRLVPMAGRKEKIATYLEALSRTTMKGMSGAFLFAPLPEFRELREARPTARRVVLEGSLIKPVIEAAREKMSADKPSAEPNEAEALAALVRLERALAEEEALGLETIQNEIYAPLFAYVTGQELRPDHSARASLAYLYGDKNADLHGRAWTSGGQSLASNLAIQRGLDRFLQWKSGIDTSAASAEQTRAQQLAKARAFVTAEDQLFQAANAPTASIEMLRLWRELEAAKTAIDPLFGAQAPPDSSTEEGKRYQRNYSRLNAAVGKVDAQGEFAPEERTLFREVRERLSGQRFDPSRLPKLADEDQKTLAENTEKIANAETRLYAARFEHYQKCRKLGGDVSKRDLVGSLGAAIKQIKAEAAKGPPPMTYDGPRKEICQRIGQVLFTAADREPLVGLLEDYRHSLSLLLANRLRFPLVTDSKEKFKDHKEMLAAVADVEKAASDFASPEFQEVDRDPAMAAAMASLQKLRLGVSQLKTVAQALPQGGKLAISLGGAREVGQPAQPPEKPKKDKEKEKDKEEEPPPEPIPAKAGVSGVSVYNGQGHPLADQEPPDKKTKPLGDLPVDDGLKVEVYGYTPGTEVRPPSLLATTDPAYQKPWGCLQLAQRYLGQTSRKTVSVSVGKISLLMEFPDSLPSKQDWPTRAGILGK